MINCKDVENKLSDYCEKNLSQDLKKQIDGHLKECIACTERVKNETLLTERLKDVKVAIPSERLRSEFYSKLYSEANKERVQRKKAFSILAVAASISLLIVGFYFGRYYRSHSEGIRMEKLVNENRTCEKQTLLALLESKSVSKRIQGVTHTESFIEVDPEIISALFGCIKYDSNINVKLAAIDALNQYPSFELVRKELVKIIENKNELEVKLAAMMVLMSFEEKRAKAPLEKMLSDPELPKAIKDQIKSNISILA